METEELLLQRVSSEGVHIFCCELKSKISRKFSEYTTKFIDLGVCTVRLQVYSKKLLSHITKELYPISDASDCFDYTIIAWETDDEDFSRYHNGQPLHIIDDEGTINMPNIIVDDARRRIVAFDKEEKTFYYGFPDHISENLAMEGHIFFKQFYQMLKPYKDASVVHGASVGIDGKGVLFCAKGNRGKSTLTVLSLLKGFEYVSDDYMVLQKRESKLFTYPIYSIMTLSPKMYDEMGEELNGVKFVSNNWNKSKYILNIDNFKENFRTNYPIEVCMFPEIVSDSEPSIVECSSLEKGKAITNMVHSTVSQMNDFTDTANTVKLMGMLKNRKFFKINLCSDIHKNVEYLGHFLKNYPAICQKD